jgi:hypothetical protein
MPMTAADGMDHDGRVRMTREWKKMRTAFTDLVGCEVPIQLAPMGAICTPELVTAVVGAGAMGMTSMPGARTAARA